jgi:tripartite-type tricarboxylate transporter receptor subunit TctC
MTTRRLAVALALAVAWALAAAAQEPYPSRPITLVAPFPPGGVADLTARPVAAALERALKHPVGVVNKTGAAGAVGMQFVATSKPDGYTLLLALSSISIIPEADKIFGRPPAFTVDQFAPIALVSADPTILVVRAESPWKTAKEFVEDAARRPGQISYSSSGIYGTLHMAMELLSHAAGIRLRHIPTAGAGPALTAILGGHVDALASGPAVILPHVKSGKLRALAGWGDRRVAALPEVPTFKELGYPDAEFYIWAGVFAPRATPEPTLTRLREAMRAAVGDAEFKAAMDRLETPIVFKQGAEFQAFFDADARRLAEGVRRVGRIEDKK